jgi:uncharacterized protein (DUF302 family)
MNASSHTVTRLTYQTPESYDVLIKRYRLAAPDLDRNRIADLVKRRADWSDVVADAAALAPFGFFIFWSMDVSESMRLAGNTAQCTEFLMGNHTIAERMYRHDPMAMLYVPLRTLIYAEVGGLTTFVIEQPSSTLASLANGDIDTVGNELDVKLATLLEHLNLMPSASELTVRPG